MRKLPLILTLAILIVALTAGMALAANLPSEVLVNDVQIYGGNAAPEANWPAGVDYDPATNTLTLNNANITAAHHYYGTEQSLQSIIRHAGIYADGDLNILLKGHNTIRISGSTEDNYYEGVALWDRGAASILQISGGGSLEIEASHNGLSVYGDYTEGHAFGNIELNDTKLTVTAGENGLFAYSNRTQENTVYEGYGNIDINNCELDIIVKQGGNDGVNAKGPATITNSIVTIKAAGDGIDSSHSVAITDSRLRTEGGQYGLKADGPISIHNSYVYAAGDLAAIASFFGGAGGAGIALSSVLIEQGGQVAEIFGMTDSIRDGHHIILASYGLVGGMMLGNGEPEGWIDHLGFTFANRQRIDAETNERFKIVALPDASSLVVLQSSEKVTDMVLPILAGVGKNFPFVDVGLNHWAYNDIFDAFKKGLINGKSATLYLPDGPLTYAEAIKLAACIHQLNSMGAVSFEPSDPWYQTYVSYAELNQIILPGEFAGKYNDAIIRYDFAHIFGKALPISAFAPINDISSITDVPSSNRHADEILMLYRAGVLAGSDASGNFNGNSNIKRSEVAAIVVRMIDPEKRIRK